MAYILMAQGEQAFIVTTLQGGAVSPAIPGSGVAWGLALMATAIGANTFANKTRTNANTGAGGTVQEIGQTTQNGYGRATGITRNATGWPNPTQPGGNSSYTTTAPQQTFTFTGAPSVNGALSWFLGKSSTRGTDDLMFGADLAAVRNFANGDTENVTVSYQQT